MNTRVSPNRVTVHHTSTIAAPRRRPHGCIYLTAYLLAYVSCALSLASDALLPSVSTETRNSKGAQMTGILEGKRALVTGGHRGIGRSIVEAFVSAGARTAIADIEGAETAAAEIGRGTAGVTCDVRSSKSVAAAVAEATRALGGLDILVNNAGVECLAPLHELTEEQFDRVVAVNLRGTWLVYKHAVPALLDGGGAILNIASIAGLVGFPLLGVYSATKGAVVRMTETMALELRDYGVRANAMCPGFVDTDMVQRSAMGFTAATGMPFDELVNKGQGRLAKPDEIAGLAVYLVSDDASFVNGTAIAVDGGMNLRRM
jgi:NAD(P)-dependent dehydrogenase (short-subunit alcohol dehydrogenase family)